MKRAMLAVLACLVLAAVSHAQETPVAEVAAGYSMIEVGKGYTFMMNGGSSSVAWNFNDWLGIVGDFGGYHATPGVNLNVETYLFGPRVSYRRWARFTPFGQVLIGGMHDSAISTGFTDAYNAFAYGLGGGFDLGLDRAGRFAFRPQLEFLGFRSSNGVITNNGRLSGSIVIRFGRKS
jgi:hypothetical protein